jgi:hypothetical protein
MSTQSGFDVAPSAPDGFPELVPVPLDAVLGASFGALKHPVPRTKKRKGARILVIALAARMEHCTLTQAMAESRVEKQRPGSLR